MAEFYLPTEGHERSYLRAELESLGLSRTRIDELTNYSDDSNSNNNNNNNSMLLILIKTTKDDLLRQFNEAHK
jgi:hypothetical protein